jgi:uncharacterized protein YbjT (DUF2867 family)
MFFVTGATGNAGGAVARALLSEGHAVRALVIAGRESGLPHGVEGIVGDLNRPEMFAPALVGARGIFLLSGYERIDVAEAHRAEVERIVLLSSSAAPGGDMTNAVARYHILSERAVRDSGLAWTFLQPNSLMSNTLRWLPQLREGDVIHDAFGDVAIAMIDPADLAAVARRSRRRSSRGRASAFPGLMRSTRPTGFASSGPPWTGSCGSSPGPTSKRERR